MQKQLSTANKALAFLAILEMALISAISVKGFEGVSKVAEMVNSAADTSV